MTIAVLHPEARFVIMIIMACLILVASGTVAMMARGGDSHPVPPQPQPKLRIPVRLVTPGC